MIDRILKAKHWQLFLLTFGIPMAFQFIMMPQMIADIGTGNAPDSSFMMNFMLLFAIMMVLFMGGLFSWFWSVAIGLQAKVPEEIKMKVRKFKIFFFIPLVYIFSFVVFFTISITGNFPNPAVFAIVIPLHFLSMFGMFYNMYFTAKTIKTVELKKETKFSDFAGEFFMIWFYPIGIWIVQPKINKLIEE